MQIIQPPLLKSHGKTTKFCHIWKWVVASRMMQHTHSIIFTRSSQLEKHMIQISETHAIGLGCRLDDI